MCVKGPLFFANQMQKREKVAAFAVTFVYLALCVKIYLMRTFCVAAIPAPFARMMY